MSYQEYQYTVNDIASKCNVSKQSIYNLIRNNRAFIKENSRKHQRRVLYNQEALNYFLSYYKRDTQETYTSENTVKPNVKDADNLQAEIKQLQEELELLKQQLAATEAERKDLLQQNGALILTLQQEKQEKMLLLPPPRKTIAERMRGWFQKGE